MCLAATELCIGLKLTDICFLAGQKNFVMSTGRFWLWLEVINSVNVSCLFASLAGRGY